MSNFKPHGVKPIANPGRAIPSHPPPKLIELLSQRLNPDQLQSKIVEQIQKYESETGRFLLVHASRLNTPDLSASLSSSDYFTLHDFLKDVPEKNLDYYLETPGGSADAAEEIIRFLHSKFDDVNFIIAGEAKSAGTIMALGGDDICMSATGSLGPIDAQVRIGNRIVSAYDYKEWMEKKREEAAKGTLNPFDAIIISQINGGELTGVEHSLEYAQDLVKEWLPKYKFKNWEFTGASHTPVDEAKKQEVASNLARELCNHRKWRSHGRAIKREHLKELGLQVRELENEPTYDTITTIQTAVRLSFGMAPITKIYATKYGIYATGGQLS